MAWTQADLDSLNEALKSGARRVRYESPTGEREVHYRSLEEMLGIRRLIMADLGLSTGGYRTYGYVNKGFGASNKSTEGGE